MTATCDTGIYSPKQLRDELLRLTIAVLPSVYENAPDGTSHSTIASNAVDLATRLSAAITETIKKGEDAGTDPKEVSPV